MDYELEMDTLVHFLFPDGIPEECQDDPEFIDYIKKLGSIPIEQLYEEKKALEEEQTTIDNQSRHLALTNYKTFIQTADCSHIVHKKIYSVEDSLNLLLNEIPSLLSKCEQFMDTSSDIKERKGKNNLILSHSTEILQILEIPQFMNTCIHNELYEEALLLASFVKRLANNHGDILLINNIAKDVDKSWWELMRRLLKQLTTDISLPKCLQIIGYLRRMNIFSEIELRLKFLQTRGSWLDSLLSNIPTDSKNEHLSVTIDITRVNVFNIATQYKAVFTEDEIITRQNDLKNSIFYSWLNKKINDFLDVVDSDLPFCAPSLLDSLLGQCMYFGQSFGRIGADFRGLVIKSFVTTIENNFKSAIEKTNERFKINMEKFVLPKTAMSSLSKTEFDSDEQVINSPTCLLEYYPLAEHYNGLISGFNDLRYCAPVGTIASVTNMLQSSLQNISTDLFFYYNKEHITWIDKEREIFSKLCVCYSKSFIPTIQRCLQALYEPVKIAKYFDVSVLYLEDEGLGYLNVSEILKPLKSLL